MTIAFINVCAKYPHQKLTIVIWADVRKQFEKTPEELFSSKEICITGRLELYKGKSQIVIRNPGQIIIAK